MSQLTINSHDWSNASSDATDSLLTEIDLQCAYSSKRCTNTRTVKKGGGLHRFCEFHRRRANEKQRRVDHKRRVLRAQRRQERQRKTHRAVDLTTMRERCLVLSAEDIQLLEAALTEVGERPEALSCNDFIPVVVHEQSCALGTDEDASFLATLKALPL